ncbi:MULTISPECIES: hypothetical protein [unclassified Kitasatospora]|nr:hypothetical protein [Kitasatospora sp. RG8]MBP0455711.1 hypothetical protein [Kitasatospora sp. RG8]
MKRITGLLLSIVYLIRPDARPSERPYSPDCDNYRQGAGSFPAGLL